MSKTEEKQTLVEEGTTFRGTLESSCKVVVRGVVEGELAAPAVEVASTGSITGEVRAKTVRSAGVLAGSVEADEVTLAGSVQSNTVIRAQKFEVRLASEQGRLEVTFGDCIIEAGDPDVALAQPEEGANEAPSQEPAAAAQGEEGAAADANEQSEALAQV